MTEVLNSAKETERVSASDPISTSIWKAMPKSECHLASGDGCRQPATGRGLAEMAASAQVDVQLRAPLKCDPEKVCLRTDIHKHTQTHILSMFSQCHYCNISTLIMKMHRGFSSSLKRRIWRQSWRAYKGQAYLQNKFWHICLDLQMSGRKVPFPWMKYLQSAELFHPQLYIQVSPGTLTWDVESPDLFRKERRTPDHQSTQSMPN